MRISANQGTFAILASWYILLWLLPSIAGCNFRYGDPALNIMYDNRREETIAMSYRYDNRDVFFEGSKVPARSSIRVPLMIQSTGVWIRGTGESGAVVFEKHHEWNELPPGEPLKIIIE